MHDTPLAEPLELITTNLGVAVAGSAAAICRFMADDTPGAIVINVSSHQAQRADPGLLPYATAKAAIEGLTRALAVDYAHRGIRVDAVALGSIATERHDERLDVARGGCIRSAALVDPRFMLVPAAGATAAPGSRTPGPDRPHDGGAR